MANTVLKINVEGGQDFFHVYDVTGAYSNNNTGGWGSPNNEISEVKSAVVKVLVPGFQQTIDVNVFPTLPNTDCIGIEIIPEDLNLDSFDPGVYQFDYTVELHNGLVLSEICHYFFYQPLECCISKRRLQTNPNDASSELANQVREMDTLLENAKRCACLGKTECAQEISDLIWAKCGCCC